MEERLDQLTDIFRDIFDDDSLEITIDTTIKEIDGWDSLLHISLMAAIQDEYRVSFDIDEITAINSVGDIIKSLDRKM